MKTPFVFPLKPVDPACPFLEIPASIVANLPPRELVFVIDEGLNRPPRILPAHSSEEALHLAKGYAPSPRVIGIKVNPTAR